MRSANIQERIGCLDLDPGDGEFGRSGAWVESAALTSRAKGEPRPPQKWVAGEPAGEEQTGETHQVGTMGLRRVWEEGGQQSAGRLPQVRGSPEALSTWT